MGSVQRLVNVTPRSAARYVFAALATLCIAIYSSTSPAAVEVWQVSYIVAQTNTAHNTHCKPGDRFYGINGGETLDSCGRPDLDTQYARSIGGVNYFWATEMSRIGTGNTVNVSYRDLHQKICASNGTTCTTRQLLRVVIQPDNTCPTGYEEWNATCKEICPSGTTRNPTTGVCQCPSGKELVNGQCLDPCPNNMLRKADGTCPNCTKTAGQKLGLISPSDILANLQSACINECKGTRGPLEITVYATGSSAGHSSTQWISTGETCTAETAPKKIKLDKQIVDANVEINTDGDDTAVVKHTPTNTEVTPTVIDSQPNESYVTGNPITLIQSTPTSNPPLVQQTNNDYYTVTYYNAQGDVTNTYHIAGSQTFNVTNTVNYTTVVNHSGGPGGGGDASAPPPYDGGGGDGEPPGDGGGDGDGGSGDGDGTCNPETETCSETPVSVEGGTARTFGESTAAFIAAVKEAPLLEAIEEATNFSAPGGHCDPLELPFEYLGMGTVSTDLHCQLASNLEMLRWVFLAIYAFMGIRIILSA